MGIVNGWMRALRGASNPADAKPRGPIAASSHGSGAGIEFFETPQPDAPTPVDRDRIISILDADGLAYFVDHEDDLGILARPGIFYIRQFGLGGAVLQIRGMWHRNGSVERARELYEIANRWNLEKIWPKAYLQVLDDGTIIIVGESSTYLPYGATDDQLETFVRDGLHSAADFFDLLDSIYPDPAATAP